MLVTIPVVYRICMTLKISKTQHQSFMLSLSFIRMFIYYLLIYYCVYAWVYCGAHVVRGQLCEVVSLLPHLCEFWMSKSGHHDCTGNSWPTDTSCWPFVLSKKTKYLSRHDGEATEAGLSQFGCQPGLPIELRISWYT